MTSAQLNDIILNVLRSHNTHGSAPVSIRATLEIKVKSGESTRLGVHVPPSEEPMHIELASRPCLMSDACCFAFTGRSYEPRSVDPIFARLADQPRILFNARGELNIYLPLYCTGGMAVENVCIEADTSACATLLDFCCFRRDVHAKCTIKELPQLLALLTTNGVRTFWKTRRSPFA